MAFQLNDVFHDHMDYYLAGPVTLKAHIPSDENKPLPICVLLNQLKLFAYAAQEIVQDLPGVCRAGNFQLPAGHGHCPPPIYPSKWSFHVKSRETLLLLCL